MVISSFIFSWLNDTHPLALRKALQEGYRKPNDGVDSKYSLILSLAFILTRYSTYLRLIRITQLYLWHGMSYKGRQRSSRKFITHIIQHPFKTFKIPSSFTPYTCFFDNPHIFCSLRSHHAIPQLRSGCRSPSCPSPCGVR